MIWTTGSGERIEISKMKNGHLMNTLRYLTNRRGGYDNDDHAEMYLAFANEMRDEAKKRGLLNEP